VTRLVVDATTFGEGLVVQAKRRTKPTLTQPQRLPNAMKWTTTAATAAPNMTHVGQVLMTAQILVWKPVFWFLVDWCRVLSQMYIE
jgi:hypothetical protein